MKDYPKINIMNSARVVRVIETVSTVGSGTEKDPTRTIIQYWDFKGNLLFTNDNYLDETISNALSEIKS